LLPIGLGLAITDYGIVYISNSLPLPFLKGSFSFYSYVFNDFRSAVSFKRLFVGTSSLYFDILSLLFLFFALYCLSSVSFKKLVSTTAFLNLTLGFVSVSGNLVSLGF
jgi:hypothetical protein